MGAILRDDPPPPSRPRARAPARARPRRPAVPREGPRRALGVGARSADRAHVDSRGRLRGERRDGEWASAAATVGARTRGLDRSRDVARGARRVGLVAARAERRGPAALAVPAGAAAQDRVAPLGRPERLARRTARRHDRHGGRRAADAMGTARGRGGIPEGGEGHRVHRRASVLVLGQPLAPVRPWHSALAGGRQWRIAAGDLRASAAGRLRWSDGQRRRRGARRVRQWPNPPRAPQRGHAGARLGARRRPRRVRPGGSVVPARRQALSVRLPLSAFDGDGGDARVQPTGRGARRCRVTRPTSRPA